MASRTSAIALGADFPASRMIRPSSVGIRACMRSAAFSRQYARVSVLDCGHDEDAAAASALATSSCVGSVT